MKELNPDLSTWSSTVKTNAILADIYDVLATINANLMAIGSGKAAKRPKPYPRPNQKNDNEQHFGKGALPPDELHRWIEEKRKQNAASSTGDDTGNSGT